MSYDQSNVVKTRKPGDKNNENGVLEKEALDLYKILLVARYAQWLPNERLCLFCLCRRNRVHPLAVL